MSNYQKFGDYDKGLLSRLFQPVDEETARDDSTMFYLATDDQDETDIWLCRQHLFNGGGCDWEHRTDSSEIKMKNPGILSDYRDMSNQ